MHDCDISYPLESRWGTCLVIPGFLSPQECEALIAMAEGLQFKCAESDYPPSYRNNERLVLDDASLAQQLFARLQGSMPASLSELTDHDGTSWRMDAVNERIRFCRYRPGQQFNIHQDGVHHRTAELQSKLTFMIYLTDGNAFDGGDTVFYADGPAGSTQDSELPAVVGRVRPRAGSLIIFDHALWHAGEAVAAGVKHIMRSDLMYQRVSTLAGLKSQRSASGLQPFSPVHQGYIWTMARLSDGRFASGGRDRAIRLWKSDGRTAGCLLGHEQSVLGLVPTTDGSLASVSRDRTLRFWNLVTGTCTRTVLAHDGAVLHIARADKGVLATSGADACIRLWNEGGDKLADLLGHAGWVWATAAVGDDRIASASEDGTVKIWSTSTAQCLQTLSVDAPLRCVAVDPERRWLAAGDVPGNVHLWSISFDVLIPHKLNCPAHNAALRCISFLSNGAIATAGEDNRAKVWDLASHALLLQVEHENFVTGLLQASPSTFLSYSYDGRILEHRLTHD